MATLFPLRILSPERVVFSGQAEEISMRSDGGEIAFLAGHEDFVGAVDITAVRIVGAVPDTSTPAATRDQGGELAVAVHGGFVEVNSKGVVLLAGVAELAGEIDIERARRALAQAEERTPADDGHEPTEGEQERLMSGAMVALLTPHSAEATARRARIRLEVAGAGSST